MTEQQKIKQRSNEVKQRVESLARNLPSAREQFVYNFFYEYSKNEARAVPQIQSATFFYNFLRLIVNLVPT